MSVETWLGRTLWTMGTPWQGAPEPTPPDGPDPYGNPDPEWLRIDWREHLRRIELPGAPVNYVEIGEGPALVFVHGLSGCWQNWLENIPHFARSHRVLALDLPGFGASPMPSWEISIRSYGRLVHDFCEVLGAGRVALVGNSMGGFISAEVAISEPARVEKLVLVSAAGISHARMHTKPAETAARMAAAMAPFGFRYREHALRRSRLRQYALRSLFWDPSGIEREFLWEVIHQGITGPGFVDAIRGLAGYDFLHQLPEIDVETLIVWGRNDQVVPPNDALGYAQRLPNSQLVVFDRCGHLPMAERPVRFNRVLDEFLAE